MDDTFQFLIGKIKSFSKKFYNSKEWMFQFLIGKIKSNYIFYNCSFKKFVSIPHR